MAQHNAALTGITPGGGKASGPSHTGGLWLICAVISILVTSLLLVAMHQYLVLVILVAGLLGEIARALVFAVGGWNKISVSALIAFEVCGLVLVGFFGCEGMLYELLLLIAVWIIKQLGEKDPETSIRGDLQEAEVEQDVPDSDPGEPPVPRRKVVIAAGCTLLLLYGLKKSFNNTRERLRKRG
jgi:hypothetical protein